MQRISMVLPSSTYRFRASGPISRDRARASRPMSWPRVTTSTSVSPGRIDVARGARRRVHGDRHEGAYVQR